MQFLMQAKIECQRFSNVKDDERKKRKEILDIIQRTTCKLGTFLLLESGRIVETTGLVAPNGDLLNHSILKTAWDNKKWAAFSKISIIDLIISRFEKKEVLVAVSIWRRHCSDSDVSSNTMRLLSSFPISTPLSDWIFWLRDEFLPNILHTTLRYTLVQYYDVVLVHIKTLKLTLIRQSVDLWIEQRARILATEYKRVYEALEVAKLLRNGAANLANSNVSGNLDFPSTSTKRNLPPGVTLGLHYHTPLCYAQHTTASYFDRDVLNVYVHSSINPKDRHFSLYTIDIQLEHLVYLWVCACLCFGQDASNLEIDRIRIIFI